MTEVPIIKKPGHCQFYIQNLKVCFPTPLEGNDKGRKTKEFQYFGFRFVKRVSTFRNDSNQKIKVES